MCDSNMFYFVDVIFLFCVFSLLLKIEGRVVFVLVPLLPCLLLFPIIFICFSQENVARHVFTNINWILFVMGQKFMAMYSVLYTYFCCFLAPNFRNNLGGRKDNDDE